MKTHFPEEDKPPADPPKVIFHDPLIPDQLRRVFGSPPKEPAKPVPPPVPPPNSYHKKPKYWQSRSTGHNTTNNRIAGVMTIFFGAIAVLHYKYTSGADRLSQRLGYSMTPEEYEVTQQMNDFHFNALTGIPADAFETDHSGEHYRNIRRLDNKVRWDVREVDKRMISIRSLSEPQDDSL